jgi:DNA-binding response OmpR family regulator
MPKILVVEDDRTVRQALAFSFESDGYSVDAVEDARKAEAALEHNAYNLVITDLILRVGAGLEVIRMVREKSEHIPIIVVTAYAESDAGRQARQMLGENFFEKPLDMAKLKSRVWELTNKSLSFV